MLSVLVDGIVPADAAHAIALQDRGFQYGDGLFESALLTGGRVRFLAEHLRRLSASCERLGIRPPVRQTMVQEIETVVSGHTEGIVKLIVTRGIAGRGYRATAGIPATRVVALYPPPEHRPDVGIRVRWCDTRLGRNARLAGMKHLNRLEQILAQSEWDGPPIEEGLMLDTEGELVCATAANLFVVREGVLVTHDLRFCGVRGIMREHVLVQAQLFGIPVSEEPLWPHDLEAASEVFVSNAVRGLRPVVQLGDLSWAPGPICSQLRQTLT